MGHDNPWAIRNPLDEARDLYKMVSSGSCPVEEIRELIAVPKLVEEALLAYAERYPRDGQQIYCVLLFREKVAREFERLIENDPAFAEEFTVLTATGLVTMYYPSETRGRDFGG